MILPTAQEPMRWRIKRFLPDLFLRRLLDGYRREKG
jgi:hypothetical protein